jgi:hypothetical protein
MKRVFQGIPAGSSSIKLHRLMAGEKSMNKKLMVIFAAAMLLVPTAPLILASATLTVQTGVKYYTPGNTVTINGVAPANVTVHLNVTYASGSVFSADAMANATTGAYASSYVLPATAFIGIYTVTATSGALTDDTVFMVTSVSTSQMAQQLINAAGQSQVLAQETIQAIIAKGYTVPPAVNATMTLGESALADAASLYSQGNYVAASEAAQRAMAQFKNAMTLAIRSGKIETPEDENATIRLQVERLQKESERISEVLTALSAAGSNVTAIEAKVTAANVSLASASSLVQAGNYTEAATAIKAARDDLKDAMQMLKTLYMQVRKELMLQYKNHLRERLNSTKGDINKLKDYLIAGNMTAAFKNFGSVESYIKRCEDRMNATDDEDALNDLEAANREFGNGIRALDSNGYSQGVGSTNNIRAQIQVLQQLEAKLKKSGQDTSAIEAQIAELQSTLNEGMGMMQNGNANGANKIFQAHGHSGGMSNGHGKGH